MISYVRGVNLHINLMISTKSIDKDLLINLWREKTVYSIAMFGHYYYILKFMLQINAFIETFTNVYKKASQISITN